MPVFDGDSGSGAAINAISDAPASAESATDGSAESAARETASLDTPSDDDEVQGDDWSDFELALGLAPGWEDEP